jgi:hypothetical protein
MIHRAVKLHIGGEEREIKFTLQALEELEVLLPNRNVFELMTRQTWAVNEIVSAMYCGLKVFDRKLTRELVSQWITSFVRDNEHGILKLNAYLIAAIGISGLVGGEKSAFEDVLKALDAEKASEGK